MTGTINALRYDRGYGFISGDDGVHYFFHMSCVKGIGFHDLERDDRVTFEPREAGKGPRAEDVALLPSSAEQVNELKDHLEQVNVS